VTRRRAGAAAAVGISVAVLLSACTGSSGHGSSPTPSDSELTTSLPLPPALSGPATVPGRRAWQMTTGALYGVTGGVLITATRDDSGVEEIDARSGTVRWRAVGDNRTERSAVAIGPTVVLLATGPTPTPYYCPGVCSSPAAQFVPDTITALDLRTGQRLWTRRVGALDGQQNIVATTGDVAVAVTRRGQVEAFDARTGSPRWTTPTRDAPTACDGSLQRPLLAGGGLLLLTLNCPGRSTVRSLDPARGTLRWTFSIGSGDDTANRVVLIDAVRAESSTVIAAVDTLGRPDTLPRLLHLAPLPPAGPEQPDGQYVIALDRRAGHLHWLAPAPGPRDLTTADGTICLGSVRQSFECRDLVDGHVTAPQGPPRGNVTGPFGEVTSAQYGHLLYTVTGGQGDGLSLTTRDSASGSEVAKLPLHISTHSAPYSDYQTTVVGAAPGLVLVRRGDTSSLPLVAYTT